MDKKLIVLKLGGSKFAKSSEVKFDFELALKLEETLSPMTDEFQFIIILGGGYLARSYQDYLRQYEVKDRDLDWVGAAANSLNATIMRVALGSEAEELVMMNTEITEADQILFEKSYLVVGGEKPGQTGDMVAVNMTIKSGADQIILLKDVDGVYSADPKDNPDAVLLEDLTWDKYHSTVSNKGEYTPGISAPVDPTASKAAQEKGIVMKVVGEDLKNLSNAIQDHSFIGTTIHA